MKDYIITVAYTCLFSGFVIALAPTGSLTKYLKLAISLVLLTVTVSPVVKIIENISENLNFSGINQQSANINEIEDTDVYEKWLVTVTKENLSSRLEEELSNHCKANCNVVPHLSYANDVMQVDGIDIYTSAANTDEILQYVKQNYSLDANIINSS